MKINHEGSARSRTKQARGSVTGAAVVLLSLAASACSDDAKVIDGGAPSTPGDAPAGEGSEGATEYQGSMYAMTVHAFGPDSTTSYLIGMPSLDEGNLMDLDTAIELPDYANASAIPGEPHVWLGYDNSPTIARWDLGADGRFRPGPTLSFANLGASAVSPDAQGAYVSPELAAVPNQDTGEVVLWNPTTMELIASIDLQLPDREGIPALIRSTVARPDGSLLLSYYYISNEGEFADVAGIVILDPERREVVARDEWEGCNYNYARAMPDGTVYLTVGAQWIQGHLVYPNGGPWTAEACLLRILPDAREFDRAFDPKSLGALSGGRLVTGNLEPTSASQAFFVAWHEELMTEPLTVENFDDTRGTIPAFKWYLWNLEAGQASMLPGEAFAGLPSVSTLDGRLFYSDQRLVDDNGGLGVSPFYELTPSGPKQAFIGFGTVWYMVKVQ